MLNYLTNIINNMIALDPKSSVILPKLYKNYLIFEINELKFLPSFKFEFNENGLLPVKNIETINTSTIISGPLFAFFALFITKNPRQATLFGLKISGEVEKSQTIQNLILNLEIDWEEFLSRFTGNTMAYYLNKMFKKFQQKQHILMQDLTHTSLEYLQEEIKFAPSKFIFEDFINKVETLTENIERLESKINLFEETYLKEETSSIQFTSFEETNAFNTDSIA